MKLFEKGDVVNFNTGFLPILKYYNDISTPYDDWEWYMRIFKDHYHNNNIRITDYKNQTFIIKDRISLTNDGVVYFYYLVMNELGHEEPLAFIPEFFNEYYLDIDDESDFKHDVFSICIQNNDIFNVNENLKNMKDDVLIKIPEFKYRPYKFKVLSDKELTLETKVGFKFYDNYALCLDNNVFKKIKVYAWLGELSKDDCIKHFCKVKIKDYQKSADIFGYKPSKKEMFESNSLFKINNILPKYESKKTNTTLDVVELDNGVKSLKFVIEDLEFIFNEPKGFTIPSKIKISNIRKKDILGKTVRVIRDKNLPIKKNDRGIIVDLWNNHQPLSGSKFNIREVSWDKNTKIKIELDNKTVICKLKNVKFVK
jgi:hypothetical protein